MALYIDVHTNVRGLSAEDMARARRRNLDLERSYGADCQEYSYDEGTRKLFCLVQAPSSAAAIAVHQKVRGLTAEEIVEVQAGRTRSNRANR